MFILVEVVDKLADTITETIGISECLSLRGLMRQFTARVQETSVYGPSAQVKKLVGGLKCRRISFGFRHYTYKYLYRVQVHVTSRAKILDGLITLLLV